MCMRLVENNQCQWLHTSKIIEFIQLSTFIKSITIRRAQKHWSIKQMTAPKPCFRNKISTENYLLCYSNYMLIFSTTHFTNNISTKSNQNFEN